MKPAIGALQSEFMDVFEAYTERAELNEKKAAAWDYLIRRGYLSNAKIAEAMKFGRLGEDDDR